MALVFLGCKIIKVQSLILISNWQYLLSRNVWILISINESLLLLIAPVWLKRILSIILLFLGILKRSHWVKGFCLIRERLLLIRVILAFSNCLWTLYLWVYLLSSNNFWSLQNISVSLHRWNSTIVRLPIIKYKRVLELL